jgi:hypothetical protein
MMAISADAFSAPVWRGDAGTTFEQWSFSEWDYGPVHPDDGWDNDYGSGPPYLVATGNYRQQVDQHSGIWNLGELDIIIPNNPVAQPEKEIWLELTWKGAGLNFLPDKPLVGVECDYEDQQIIPQIQINQDPPATGTDGWKTTLYKIQIWPNPSSEWIAIKGDIFADKVVIDTFCKIPEPGVLSLLGLGALFGLKRKRGV